MPGLPLELINYINKYSYLIFIFVLLQGSLLVILFYIFADKITNARKVKLEKEVIKQEAYTKALKILEDAKDTSLKVIEEANKKAQALLSDTQLLNNEVKHDLNTQLENLTDKHVQLLSQTSQEFITSYKSTLTQEVSATKDSLHETSDSVKNALLQEVDQFKETLRKDTYEAEEAVQKKITDEYAAVRGELDAYKKKKIESLDSKIYEILFQVVKESAGVVIDVDTHKQVILNFLNEAKKEHRL